jgi:hypothetical protein
MDRRMDWADADLLIALNRYQDELSRAPLSPITVQSYVDYGRRFLRWRSGDYLPRGMPRPAQRPVSVGKRDLADLRRELRQYEAVLDGAGLQPGATRTYVSDAAQFVRWLGGEYAPRGSARIPLTPSAPRRTEALLSPRAASLDSEFVRIREGHQTAVLRTVARASLPGSVTRVFLRGTKEALTSLFPTLPVDELPALSTKPDYRIWFESALRPVAGTIVGLNPVTRNPRIHPGYAWGHGTKVLSLFVRDLVLFSRYFTEDDARRIEPWLYCPVDGIVIERLRRVGFDPGVRFIREIGEAAFWRIQDSLSAAAALAGVPPVWFDDVWSEARH